MLIKRSEINIKSSAIYVSIQSFIIFLNVSLEQIFSLVPSVKYSTSVHNCHGYFQTSVGH
jgi:hypothetical protein